MTMGWTTCLLPAGVVIGLVACSAGGGGSGRLTVGTEGSGGANERGSGGAGSGRISIPDSGLVSQLSAHIEENQIEVTFVTLSCAGDCVDVQAVARGGREPYAYTWEDASTDPHRRLCPRATTAFSVSVKDDGIPSGEFKRAPLTATAEVTASVMDCAAGAGGAPGAGGAESAGGATGTGGFTGATCPDGEELLVGDVTTGAVVYLQGGGALPAGRYRASYADGCMKFGPPVGWTVHNIFQANWFLVGDTTVANIATLPGVSGAGYAAFAECVTACKASPPVEFDFTGGKLGAWLSDAPLTDNVEGENGRNPSWCVKRLDGTP